MADAVLRSFGGRSNLCMIKRGLCGGKRVSELENRIRYVAILDRTQRLKESRMRSNVPSLTPEAYDRKFMSSVPPLVLDALQQLEAQCGQLEQISIQYQRVDMVFFSFDNQIVVLSLEPGPMEPIWRKLRDTLGLPVRG